MTFLTHPEGEPDLERLRAHEADFTPYPVVRQCLKHAAKHAGWTGEPASVCDPAAGAGVWCKAMRNEWGPSLHIVAIEKREEERFILGRHADEVHIGDAIDWAEAYAGGDDFDLVATNPPFSRFAEYADRFLRISFDVWLFAPVDANVRGEEANEWLRDHAKYVQRCLWVPGGIGFRGPGKNEKGKQNGQDHRQYGLWMLTAGLTDDENGWPVTLLPRLPGHDRRWVTRPGTEGEA